MLHARTREVIHEQPHKGRLATNHHTLGVQLVLAHELGGSQRPEDSQHQVHVVLCGAGTRTHGGGAREGLHGKAGHGAQHARPGHEVLKRGKRYARRDGHDGAPVQEARQPCHDTGEHLRLDRQHNQVGISLRQHGGRVRVAGDAQLAQGLHLGLVRI